MRILHYTLGFPPFRSGGLVFYAKELMDEQIKQGHEILALYPGEVNIFTNKTSIKSDKSSKFQKYQIINSLPLPIFGGIKSPKDFKQEVSIEIYLDFLKQTKPDVIHVHTLMGIHLEFFLAACELSIPLVYTTHDYFGLAPEPNFYFNGNSYDSANTIENWILASTNSMDTWKLRIFQANFYPLVKNKIKKITKLLNNNKINMSIRNGLQDIISENIKENYLGLKEYYLKIFTLIDFFHFNSKTSEEVFKNNINVDINGKVITITNSSIMDSNASGTNKEYSRKTRLAYIGPDKDYKGFCSFIDLASNLSAEDFEFHTYGYDSRSELVNIIQHGRYDRYKISEMYRNIDILIVPSKWKETFGLIVIEALSNNTPVLVSENVGAKDLIPEKYIFVDLEDLVQIIVGQEINLSDFDFKVKKMSMHGKEILSIYSEVIKA